MIGDPHYSTLYVRFAHLEGGGAPGKGPNLGQATSLPRERVKEFQHEAQRYMVAGQQPPMPHGQARWHSGLRP